MEIVEAIVGNINPLAKTSYVGHYLVITFNTDSTPYVSTYHQTLLLKEQLRAIGITTRTTGYPNGLYFDL